jgi:hypothetical protein
MVQMNLQSRLLGRLPLMVSLDQPQTYGLAKVPFWFEFWNCAISIGLMIVSLRECLVLIRGHLVFDRITSCHAISIIWACSSLDGVLWKR